MIHYEVEVIEGDQIRPTEVRCDYVIIHGDLVGFYRYSDSTNTMSTLLKGVCELPFLVMNASAIRTMQLTKGES